MLLTMVGSPPERISARPVTADSEPRVTTKSGILPAVMSRPFRKPSLPVTRMARMQARRM